MIGRRKMTSTLTEGGSSDLMTGGVLDSQGRRWRERMITPQLAQEILEERNSRNRNPSERNITQFSRDMAAGKWRSGNGQTIAFKPDGSLADGQNRLFSVIRAHALNPDFQGIVFMMVEGVTEEDMATIDTGKSRSFGDVLKLSGETNTYQLAAAANALFYYYFPERHLRLADRPTHEELLSFFADHEVLREHVQDGVKMSNAAKLSRPVCTAVAYEVRRLHGVNFNPWTTFQEKLITGYDIAPGDPVGALRNYGMQGTVRIDASSTYDLRRNTFIGMAKAWNGVMTGKEIKRIKVGDNEEIPTII